MTRAMLALATVLLAGRAAAAKWTPVAAAGVEVSLSPFGESSLRIAYDFHGGSGWAGARRAIAFDFPDDWTLIPYRGGMQPLTDV